MGPDIKRYNHNMSTYECGSTGQVCTHPDLEREQQTLNLSETDALALRVTSHNKIDCANKSKHTLMTN